MSDRAIVACVDDDFSIREALEGFLFSVGYGAALFASAEDFLCYPRIAEVGCLITDIRLGGMSGIDLLRVLVARGNNIPAIVISAFDEAQLRALAFGAGAVGFLGKPICDAELLALLEDIFGRRSP